jgi:bifunctional non-homologous end joining protein LigD
MTETSRLVVDGHEIDLSNPDKTLFPAEWDDGPITKVDLVDYYRRVADTMLPHLRYRAVVMTRYPDGIAGEGFYQKHVPDYFPDWVRRAELPKENGTVAHAVCDDAATLVYLAAHACVTLHVWLSRVDRPRQPDRMTFDIDPDGPDFEPVRLAARSLRSTLEREGLTPFVQTTGSKGLHVVTPLEPGPDFDAVREVARALAHEVVDANPDILTLEQRKAARHGRVYIDVMRNAYAQSAVAPYAVRALPGAPVATPLEWHELSSTKLDPQSYNLHNLFRRLGQREDPWAAMADEARSLEKLQLRL